MRCLSCGGTEIEYSEAGGESVCVGCGTILEESTIVNAVEFSESAAGTSSIVGKLVSGTATRSYGGMVGGFGLSRESREIVIDNGKKTMQQLSSSLRLNQYLVDAAHRLFMLAVEHNFLQGRKTLNVIAACLYIVCRREKTEHLLIDFADSLQINVYALGACFLKFTRLLSINLPVIDPSLFIHRFANKLDFGEKRQLVSTTALRVVQRMQRDWLHTGRRPAGICGAALLLAARIHGFERTRDEVLKVVRVTDDTLKSRLSELSSTSAGALTVDEFETMELEDEGDPPSFTRNEIEEKLAIEGVTLPMLEDGDECEEEQGEKKGEEEEQEEEKVEEEAKEEGEEEESTGGRRKKKVAAKTAKKKTPLSRKVIAKQQKQKHELALYSALSESFGADLSAAKQSQPALADVSQARPSTSSAAVSAQAGAIVNVDALPIVDGGETLSDSDDCISGCLHTEEDARVRLEEWEKRNRDYLMEKAAKAARGEPAPAPRKRRKPGDTSYGGQLAIGSPAPSARLPAASPMPTPDAVAIQRKSKKLNYSALAATGAAAEYTI